MARWYFTYISPSISLSMGWYDLVVQCTPAKCKIAGRIKSIQLCEGDCEGEGGDGDLLGGG